MGHDGRCGYIHHLVVKKDYRRMKIGEMMVQTCMEKLGSLGMTRCHIFVLPENTIAIKFWEKMKFIVRSNVSLMTFNSESNV